MPRILIAEEDLVGDVTAKLRANSYARSFFITGVRGSGKTVLMTKVEEELRRDKQFIVIDVSNNEDLLADLKERLLRAVLGPLKVKLQDLRSFGAAGVSVGISAGAASEQNQIQDLLEVARRHQKIVVVAIDEVTNSPEIRKFAQLFSLTKRLGLPLNVLMTGLPEVILDVQNEDRMTFLLRSEKITLTSLGIDQMVQAYQDQLGVDAFLARHLAKLTGGYSYAFQLLGSLAFDQTQAGNLTTREVTGLLPLFKENLFDNAYQRIFDASSPVDQRYLVAVANSPLFGDVLERMGKSKSYVSQYRRRALERHLIRAAGHGQVAFTLPCFRDFLLATQDLDSLYYQPVDFD